MLGRTQESVAALYQLLFLSGRVRVWVQGARHWAVGVGALAAFQGPELC